MSLSRFHCVWNGLAFLKYYLSETVNETVNETANKTCFWVGEFTVAPEVNMAKAVCKLNGEMTKLPGTSWDI